VGIPTEPGPASSPPGGSVADRVAGFPPLSTAPAAAPLPFATDASTMTVRQPRTSQEPSTTQVTSPRPATAPRGWSPGRPRRARARRSPTRSRSRPAWPRPRPHRCWPTWRPRGSRTRPARPGPAATTPGRGPGGEQDQPDGGVDPARPPPHPDHRRQHGRGQHQRAARPEQPPGQPLVERPGQDPAGAEGARPAPGRWGRGPASPSPRPGSAPRRRTAPRPGPRRNGPAASAWPGRRRSPGRPPRRRPRPWPPGGQQGHGLDPGRDGQGDPGDQRGIPVDEEIDGQQEQGHGHPDPVAVDAGGHEQHRADRDQDRRPGAQLERPAGPQHLEDQQGRPQVGHAGRDRARRSTGVPPPAAVARAIASSLTASAASAVTSTSRLSELK
jgi:hypothetical protein